MLVIFSVFSVVLPLCPFETTLRVFCDMADVSRPQLEVYVDDEPLPKANNSKRQHQDDPDLPAPNSLSKRRTGAPLQTLTNVSTGALQASYLGSVCTLVKEFDD